MKSQKKSNFNMANIIFVVLIILLLIPQTRITLQIWMHKGLSLINQSSLIDEKDREIISYTNWQLRGDANTSIKFEETKGQVVFINFWATWCPPCIAEMAGIQELYDDYNEKVVFLLITNDSFDTVEKFKQKRGFDFEVFNPLNQAPEELSVRTIPRTFIINKKREIVVDESAALDWNNNKVRAQLNDLLLE
ncbi:hypothetical protein GCM10008085_23390 [Winogradskyella epiphytica]|nr:TlpA disulfide reductase family protein [Winogradskyella epiphytica]GGW70647.1 hypothetical protein GCM10008085_23390 [Winogradskyella epiphytica]